MKSEIFRQAIIQNVCTIYHVKNVKNNYWFKEIMSYILIFMLNKISGFVVLKNFNNSDPGCFSRVGSGSCNFVSKDK